MFVMNGRPLLDGGTVPLDRCGGVRLLVQDPIGGQSYELLGEMNNTWLGNQRAGFFEHLPLLANGRLELSLQAWQDRLQALLACSDDADEFIRLCVLGTQKVLASARVTRFDARLESDYAARRVDIEGACLAASRRRGPRAHPTLPASSVGPRARAVAVGAGPVPGW
jgi:hypothetical protein